MPNTRDADVSSTKRILVAGRTGTGKSSQIWTLPGKRFAYIFDPNALSALVAQPPYKQQGCDLDYELFLPEISSVDAALKGFNKGSRDDVTKRRVEPKLYNRWEEDVNKKSAEGFFDKYNWIVIDSLTFLSKAVMDRQLFLNNRYGGTEEMADYKVVGSKLAEVFAAITSAPINLYCTAHLSVFQDEKTSRLETQLYLPGRARTILPLQFTDIFLATTRDDEKRGTIYEIRTKPDPRGLQDIRTSIQGLDTFEDVTIGRFDDRSVEYGIGALISGKKRK